MPEIIRFEDEECDGLYIRNVLGLPIFHANDVVGIEDPLVTFYRILLATYPCAALIGTMAIPGYDPDAMFSSFFREGSDYLLTTVNSYAHGIIWVEENPRSGCFFPHLPASFFDLAEDGALIARQLMSYDQPLLYVNADSEALSRLTAFHTQPPFPSGIFVYREDRWWQEITRFIPLCLWGGYDEGHLTAYTRDPDVFKLLDPILARICESIRATSWFQEHQHELHWPEDELRTRYWCLTLPEKIDAMRERERRRQENLRKREEEQK